MEERRAIVRTRVRRDAEIVIDRRTGERIPCVLRDLTNAGACIGFDETHALPDTFALTLDQGRSLRQCRVRWRSDDRLGVSFEKPANEAGVAPSWPAQRKAAGVA